LAEKNFSGSTVPSAAVGKACADGFYVFADGVGRSAKELFPVVQDGITSNGKMGRSLRKLDFFLASSYRF
jgi:hypothetical protein